MTARCACGRFMKAGWTCCNQCTLAAGDTIDAGERAVAALRIAQTAATGAQHRPPTRKRRTKWFHLLRAR